MSTAAAAALERLILDSGKPRTGMRTDNVQIVESPRMLDSIDEFSRIARSALDAMAGDPDEVADARRRRCRTQVLTWTPHAAGYLGQVTNGRWHAIVQNQARHMLHGQQVRQYNGKWAIASSAFSTFFVERLETRTTNAADRDLDDQFRSIKRKRSVRHFAVVLELIDLKGADAARFGPDGMPLGDVDPGSVHPDVAAMLAAIQTPPTPTTETTTDEVADLRESNAQLQTELADMRAMLARLETMLGGGGAPADASQDTPAAEAPAEASQDTAAAAAETPAPKRRRGRRSSTAAAVLGDET